MSWLEFKSLLSGLLPKTPLGGIVQLRSENDPDRLKEFTKEQHRIRNEWRNRNRKIKEDKKAFEEMQNILKQAFS